MKFNAAVLVWAAAFASADCALLMHGRGQLKRPSEVRMAHINFVWVRGEESMNDLVAMARAPRGRSFMQTSLQSRLARSSREMGIHDQGGNFGGLEFFTEALLKDLPGDTIRRIDRCNVNGHGGNHRDGGGDPLERMGQGSPKVWIVVNGEDYSGEYYYDRWLSSLIRAGHEVVLLGNKWNSSVADFSGHGITSLWVPFASLNFAERKSFTPMDLVHLPEASLNGVRVGTLAYQSRICQSDRERLFDLLEKELFNATGQHASALSRCHGQTTSLSLVSPLNLELPSDPLSHFDESVERYQKFKFTMSPEHNVNDIGYVTEKLVEGLLAGSVPIYAGDFAAAAEMFDMRGVVRADFSSQAGMVATAKEVVRLAQDPEAYEHKRRHEPLVLEQALRKQFSWHPAVWPKHGDWLRQRIVGEILRACEDP